MSSRRFPPGFIDRVADATDILAIIGRYTNLRSRGNRHFGLCPFHNEKTPSFSVDPEQGLYYCFGCHAGGNVFTFLMDKEGLTFSEAVESLANDAGLEIPKTVTGGERPEGMREAAEFAAKFFQKAIESEIGVEAREYLAKRGISKDTWKAFGLGWAPEDRNHLPRSTRMAKRKIDPFIEIGLIRKPKYGGDYYSGIQDALVFPIQKSSGKTVGFAQRKIRDDGSGGPKYINSADNDIYHKSSLLYGLPQARKAIRKEGKSILVEGYFDVIALAEKGIENAVGSCGTAFTSQQATLLARYAPHVVVLFDGDEAGLKATLRSLEILLGAGLDPSVIRLAEKDDPDSFVMEQGADSLRALIDKAPGWFDWLFDYASKGSSEESVSAAVSVIDAIAMPLAAVQDEMTRNMFIRELEKKMGTSPDAIRDHLRKAYRKKRGVGRSEEPKERVPELSDIAKLELAILAAVIRSEKLLDENPLSLYSGLWDSVAEGVGTAEMLASISDERARSRLSEMLLQPEPTDLDCHIKSLVRKLNKIRVDSELESLNADLREAERIGDFESQKKILEKLTGLGIKLSALCRGAF